MRFSAKPLLLLDTQLISASPTLFDRPDLNGEMPPTIRRSDGHNPFPSKVWYFTILFVPIDVIDYSGLGWYARVLVGRS